MKRLLIKFRDKNDGAVTVDWVVLTGVAIALALFTLLAMGDVVDAGLTRIYAGLARY